MAVVRIRIVAQNDPSLKRSILDYVGMVNKADKAIVQSTQRAQADKMRIVQGGYRQSAREEKQQTSIVEKEAATRAKAHERALAHVARVKDRYFADQQRSEERAGAATVVRAKAIGRETVATMAKVGKAVVGLAIGAGNAIGVDTSATSIISKGVSFEKSIVDVSNSGAKGAATPQDIATNRAAVVGAADKTFTDVNTMSAALGAYVKLTGDIDSGRKSLEMFGKLARATGTDVVDLAGAAGQIANGLGDVPDKAAIVEEALRVVAQQGKLGSVEISDLATHMGKFASKAQFFEGSREDVMATLGAVAQLSMKGGASTAAEAASAAGNFNRDISTDSAKEAFAKYGVERKGKNGRFRDAGDIIVDALKATGGDGEKLQEMFRNQSSRKGVLGAAGIFNQAGGGEAGAKAVRAEFAKLRQSITKENVEKNFQNSANTTEAKATAFNNKMQEVGTKVLEGIMPSMEKMAPSLIQIAEAAARLAPALASVAQWAANNPFTAIVAALGASLLKAGIANVIKDGLSNLLKPGGGGPGGGGPGGAGGGRGATATAVAAASWGYFFDKAAEIDAGQTRDAQGLVDIGNVNATEANKGDNQALYRLFGNIHDMEAALANANMPGSVVKDKSAWESSLASMKEQRDSAMSNLSPGDRAMMMVAGITGKRSAVPEDSFRPAGNGRDENNAPTEVRDASSKSASILLAGAEALKNAGLAEAAAALQSAAAALTAAAAAGPPKDGTTR